MRKNNFKSILPTAYMIAIFLSLSSSAFAGDRVVVIPLGGGAQSGIAGCNECDDTFINENQSDSITSSMIVDGQIGAGDISINQVQIRVDNSCSAGSSIRSINSDGSVECELISDSGGDITEVTAGTGLSGGGSSGTVTVSADTSYIQRRVSSICAAGSSIRAIAEDGSVTCETDSDSGDITGVTAGTGLSGGGSSGAVTVSAALPFSLSGDVAGGVIRGISSRSGTDNPGYGVYGAASQNFGTGVYGYASDTAGIGVKAVSKYGHALYAESKYGHALYAESKYGSAYHSGYFTSNVSSGTAGASLYARTDNSTGHGIALWAHNDHSSSTDASVVISNDGSGPLLKGFGGDGGNEEFTIENDGSLHIVDPSIDDDVFHLEAARGLLTLGSGSSTTPGDDGDIWITNASGSTTIALDGAGGNIEAFNGSSKRTILIDPQESSDITTAGGQITLYDPDGTASIEIDGDYSGHGNIRLYNNDHNLRVNLDGSDGFVADFYGNVRIRDNAGTTVMELGAGLDYAEGFNVSNGERILAGSVLIIDPDNPGQLRLSETAYDTKVAGIVAGANGLGSGVRLGADEFDKDVALAGRVYCNVDTSQVGINTGDLLTTSSTPGYAMRADDYNRAQGAILGKAMETIAKGQKGQILVLVTLQ